jgi:DNA-binding NtrC family response regulator
VLEARHALVRHCNSPALRARSGSPTGFLRWDANGTPAPAASGQPIAIPRGMAELLLAVEPPALPADLAGGGYWEALERYECRIIAAGLARCGGKIKPAARLLGMSRTALRDKARKYGLSSVA